MHIQERNLEEQAIYEKFRSDTKEKLKQHLEGQNIVVKDCLSLVEATLHRLFYQQGLEFSNFVLNGENQEAFEKQLPDIISVIVDESPVVQKNKENVKISLLMTIRDIVYNGTIEQKLLLHRLSSTYMMLFLLQCDPKLCLYFKSMASKLNIYVGTSIIVPALSEIYLDPIHRRHWNLLKSAKEAGINMIINELILTEVISHFKMIINNYESQYTEFEDILNNEAQVLIVDEIMIRAYFYAKLRGDVDNFHSFIENFVSYDLKHAGEQLMEWLKDEFGIVYKSNKSLQIERDVKETEKLFLALKGQKTHPAKARTDAEFVLGIYALRESNNETDTAGIFGYRTWWLSKDTVTVRTVNKVFKDKYRVSCYIRPDFLYNYICLSPGRQAVDAAYSELFPTLIGVNISYHLPVEVGKYVKSIIKEHKAKIPSRIKGMLRDLTERLKSDPNLAARAYLTHHLDDLKKMLQSEN